MNWFHNLKISQKLAIGFGVCLALAICASVVAINRMGVMNTNTQELGECRLANTQNLAKLIADVRQYRAYQTMSIIHKKKAEIQSDVNSEIELTGAIDADLESYSKLAVDPDDKANLDKFKEGWRAYREFDRPINSAAFANNSAEAYKVLAVDANSAWDATRQQIPVMLEWNSKSSKAVLHESSGSYADAVKITITLLVIAIIVGIAMTIFVAGQISASIGTADRLVDQLENVGFPAMTVAIEGMAAGDLTVEIPSRIKNIEANGADEIGSLCIRMNEMIDYFREMASAFRTAQKNLNDMIVQSKSASDTIASSSSQIASGNQDLAHRTSEQAANLEETAASIEEISSLISQSAQRASDASELASQTKELALTGGSVVDAAVEAMRGIEKSSKQIEAIISVIDEIAFQTNLLSLNAAVEAARVGEQGKGFAVVASEVRSLAGRSATAAKEIKNLVLDSVQKVEQGTELVNKSGVELRQIVDAVHKVADMVSEISTSAQEEAVGIEQINKAVVQMDQITQQNAALVEEASAASEAMSQQAEELSESVKQFRLCESGRQSSFSDNEPVRKAPVLSLVETRASRASSALSRRKIANSSIKVQEDEF
jgi:methyl-accepting chemotaxis protein